MNLRAKVRLAALLPVLFGLALLTLVGRWLVQGLDQLAVGIQRLAGGDLAAVVPVTGRDELAALGHAFNSMTARLRDSYTSIERLGREVAERELVEEFRRGSEARLRGLSAELERRVLERTAELTAANQEPESFAYAVSHDLRAPLRALNGFSQALIEDYGGQLQGEARDYLDQIGLASGRMGDLIEGLLVLSRSTRGDLQRDSVDLSALVGPILGEWVQAEPRRLVDLDVQPGLIAQGDARMIGVVMRNLLGNAWKYSARVPAARIRVYVFRAGDFVDREGPDLPAVVLLDIALPRLSGLEVLERLRADPRTALVPVVRRNWICACGARMGPHSGSATSVTPCSIRMGPTWVGAAPTATSLHASWPRRSCANSPRRWSRARRASPSSPRCASRMGASPTMWPSRRTSPTSAAPPRNWSATATTWRNWSPSAPLS